MSNTTKFIDNRQYHKSNYDKAINYLIPKIYFEQEYNSDEKELDILDQVINSHLAIISNISSVINVSGVPGTIYSSINTAKGISQFFVKQNKLTELSINDFERKILLPLGKSFRDFITSSDFSNYLNQTLLPGIRLNKPTLDFLNGAAPSANHNYLITNLSWLYFLNLSGPQTLAYQPSSYVHEALIDNIYRSNPVLINDGIKGLTEYIWRNYTTCTTWQGKGLLPTDLIPPAAGLSLVNSYTSGTNQLDRLKTLVDIVYSPLYIDDGDFRVRDAINDYLNAGITISEKIPNGPFTRLVKAFAFSFADYSNQIDRLEVLNDIDECPEDLLPLLANLIGWKLFGPDPDRWRLQIANAIDVYKTAGTKKSIQFAIDSVFTKDVFNVSSKISEQWESYVPDLIYYSLATESGLLKDLTTFTPTVAQQFNISGYSFSSLDHNIRLCVDQIIYDLVREYPDQFYLGREKFPLNSLTFVFNYRNRLFKVPPFEERSYYTRVLITPQMINFIVDKLVCFGVPESFAIQVGNYISNKTLHSDEDVSIKNSWLFFTSGVEYPPNWDTLIKDISNNKIEYISLWSGKSSHFKVIFESSDFNFSKTSLESDSRESLKIASKIVNDFAPAHSVADVIAKTSSIDYFDSSNVVFPYVSIDKLEHPQLKIDNNPIIAGYYTSSISMETYKRGIASSKPTMNRYSVDSLVDSLINGTGGTASLARRNHRRRNFKFTLPRDGYYDRTGFNMPVPMDRYTTNNTFLPLGLIPSSQQYVTISNYSSIPSIYSICENLQSSNIYSGLIVSNTFPVRGWRGIESDAKRVINGTRPDYFIDRGQLSPIIAVMHYIKEKTKLFEASSYYYYNNTDFINNSRWLNILQSYANSSTEFSGNFPNSFSNYTDFGFGRQFHKFYEDYTHNFKRHRTIPTVMYLDGPTIFGHAFGSAIKNSKLNDLGWLAQTNSNFITSSLSNFKELAVGSTLFSTTGLTLGTYIADSTPNISVADREFRCSSLLDSVELCQVSGSSPTNSFSIIKLNKTNKDPDSNLLLYDNTVIKQRSVNGLGRIRFDLGKYPTNSQQGYDVTYNFLTPEHKFKLSLKSLISDKQGLNLGNGSIGIWIHTKEEGNMAWSYLPNGDWIHHSVSSITPEIIINNYTHKRYFRPKQRPVDDISTKQCLNYLNEQNENKFNDVLSTFKEKDFNNIEVEFNTENLNLLIDSNYDSIVGKQVHRLSQNYIIEIFTIPNDNDNFTLFYDISLLDLTLNKYSKPLVGGIPNNSTMGDIYCKEFRVDLSREQVLTIIKYFNDLAGAYTNFGYGSRVASYTSGVYEISGGSRINYTESPYWNYYEVTGNGSNAIKYIELLN